MSYSDIMRTRADHHRRIHGEQGSLYADLNLSVVSRWNVVPISRPQNVAEHSWRVARIVEEFTNHLGYNSDEANCLIVIAMRHDLDEAISGDQPSTLKERKPIQSLNAAILKMADILEAQEYIKIWGVGPKRAGVLDYLNDELRHVVNECGSMLGPNSLNLQTAVARVSLSLANRDE